MTALRHSLGEHSNGSPAFRVSRGAHGPGRLALGDPRPLVPRPHDGPVHQGNGSATITYRSTMYHDGDSQRI
eukprot:71483-Prymnesium_polylepis.1